jgi:hypothetical protein
VQRPRLAGNAHGVGEVRDRLGVQVEAQLVEVVDVVAAHRPRMERKRAHLRLHGLCKRCECPQPSSAVSIGIARSVTRRP